MVRRSVATLAVAACSQGTPEPAAPSLAPFVEHALATAHGLSGLAIDDTGALWTVAERAELAYRIEVAPEGAPRVEAFAIDGVPRGVDLEGVAWLGEDRFAFGTEDNQRGVATVLLAHRRGTRIAVTGTVAIPAERIGIALPPNHGAEGICGRGDTLVVAIEGAGVDAGVRWAPLVLIARGEAVATHHLRLTSSTGKLAALDCTIDEQGTIRGWAIERHFEVTKILAFELPAGAPEGSTLVPRVALDLGATLNGRLNLEGVARDPGGRTFAIVDNQWRTIDGPSRLLVFPAGAVP